MYKNVYMLNINAPLTPPKHIRIYVKIMLKWFGIMNLIFFFFFYNLGLSMVCQIMLFTV